jgi:4-amino-4-deoxy-L-arabinose transferase-like glycosyltransferase
LRERLSCGSGSRTLERAWSRIQPAAVVALALLVRLPGLLLGVEHYGDAPVRVEIAERWAAAPHFFRGFSEVYQYGPLHLALIGGALLVHPDRILSPRLLSLCFGLLGVFLLWRLTRRAFGDGAAWLAALGLSLDTVHLQASTSAASEAVFLGLFLLCLELLALSGALAPDSEARPIDPSSVRRAPLLLAALALAAAGLVRYDGWMLAALVCGLLLLRVLSRRLRASDLLLFAVVCALPALWWMWRNQLDSGDALRPLHHVNEDHRALADQALRWFGSARYRLYCAFYWPVNLLVLSSPLLGALSLLGALRALWRRSTGWEYAALAWLPPAYLTLRGAVLADFRPMSRFVLTAAALSLPFAWAPLAELGLRFGARARTAVLACALALAAATPLFFFAASQGRNGDLAEWARPLSPVSSVPPGIAEAARYLHQTASPQDFVLLDGVWDYLEIPLAFESGLPESQFIRQAYDNFDAKLAKVTPTRAVLLYQGNLQWSPGAKGASFQAGRFEFRGLQFCREAAFVYASVYRRCPTG